VRDNTGVTPVEGADWTFVSLVTDQGPHRGIYLADAERCVVVGNDLEGAGSEHCIETWNTTPPDAQHVIQGNRLDGTEEISDVYYAPETHYGTHTFKGTWAYPIYLGTNAVWVDATGDLRIKSSAPTTDLDGTIVGTQS
jgi:hypothetical protein